MGNLCKQGKLMKSEEKQERGKRWFKVYRGSVRQMDVEAGQGRGRWVERTERFYRWIVAAFAGRACDYTYMTFAGTLSASMLIFLSTIPPVACLVQ